MSRPTALLSRTLAAILLLGGISGCAAQPGDIYARSPAYQPAPGGVYVGSGTAAGWGDHYANGFGYANPLTDPGPASAGFR